jgi:putative ABC transport system permease protein
MPDWKRIVQRQLAPLRLPPARELEIAEELAQHLEAVYEAALAAGASEPEARQQALAQIHDGRLLECELSRAERAFAACTFQQPLEFIERKGGMRMESLWQDLRFGARMLGKRPAFTLIAVLTLALGIGASTAIFSVVNGVLLRPLPFAEPERIVTLWEHNPKDGLERDDVSPANFLDWRERNRSFADLASVNPYSLDYQGKTAPETWQAALVSEGFFNLLGVNAYVGRTFLPEEYRDGINFDDNRQVKSFPVVLSYQLWQQRFGGDRALIGQTLSLDGLPATVVGVLPPEFQLRLFEQERQVYAPQAPDEGWRQQRRATYLKILGRLKPEVSLEQARADLRTIAAQLEAEYPRTNGGVGVTVVSLPDHLTGQVRPALWILFGAVGFVLLIACANVANLLLTRGAEREREFAIRAALGAGRGRLLRQLLSESLLLALAGCAAGLLLAYWGITAIIALSPGNIPRLELVKLDYATLLFAAALSTATALLFGLAPALQFSRPELQHSLKEAALTASGRPVRRRLRGALVVAEVALSLVLLVGAGLLLRSFVTLLQTDPGFAAERVVALQAFIQDRYPKAEQRVAYAQAVLDKLRSVPGVTAAGLTTALPFLESSLSTSLPFTVEGRPVPPLGQEPTVFWSVATPEYFDTIGVRLLRGRMFNEFDKIDAPPVALISETMARRHFPNEDPIGRKLVTRGRQRGNGPQQAVEIVGIVSDVRHDGLDKEPRAEHYRPFHQIPNGSLIFAVRTSADPATLIPTLKARLWEVNTTQPLYAVETLDKLVFASLQTRRFSLVLLGAFAALALALAVVGIYGVMSFVTAQRTHEIGIRMALGAGAGDILRLILRQGMQLTLLGIGAGLAAALLLTRLLRTLLYGVSTSDPLTFAGVALLLMLVALAACWLPARRATRIDPLSALRHE